MAQEDWRAAGMECPNFERRGSTLERMNSANSQERIRLPRPSSDRTPAIGVENGTLCHRTSPKGRPSGLVSPQASVERGTEAFVRGFPREPPAYAPGEAGRPNDDQTRQPGSPGEGNGSGPAVGDRPQARRDRWSPTSRTARYDECDTG
ncbi:hypothetical protein VTN00DRAFT_9333 [Thermoascus crustaceus]|uniref:uncharacterized protein n=1 Tax=Thermoascus crustaceus TaxID=5088 RepID=UPI0037425F40